MLHGYETLPCCEIRGAAAFYLPANFYPQAKVLGSAKVYPMVNGW